jgi:hypothetical protein
VQRDHLRTIGIGRFQLDGGNAITKYFAKLSKLIRYDLIPNIALEETPAIILVL